MDQHISILGVFTIYDIDPDSNNLLDSLTWVK